MDAVFVVAGNGLNEPIPRQRPFFRLAGSMFVRFGRIPTSFPAVNGVAVERYYSIPVRGEDQCDDGGVRLLRDSHLLGETNVPDVDTIGASNRQNAAIRRERQR